MVNEIQNCFYYRAPSLLLTLVRSHHLQIWHFIFVGSENNFAVFYNFFADSLHYHTVASKWRGNLKEIYENKRIESVCNNNYVAY